MNRNADINNKTNGGETMLICSLDISKNHYALILQDLDTKEFKVCFGWGCKTAVKKWKKQFPEYHIHYLEGKRPGETVECYNMRAAGNIISAIYLEDMNVGNPDIISIEGYAYLGSKVVDIAEVMGAVKHYLYDDGVCFRTHDPQSVKMWAGNGGYSKPQMVEAARKHIRIPEEFTKTKSNPGQDIADAFFLLIMLEWEIKIRRDPLMMKHLNEKQKQIFNRITRGNPVGLLNRNFIGVRQPEIS